MSIVLTFLSGLVALKFEGLISDSFFWALFGAGIWVAWIGFLDDHSHIPARWRLLAHFSGACWALFFLKGLPPLQLFGATFSLSWIGHLLALIYLVWILNLYNFMDGIDGIAAIEAITVSLGACLLYILSSEAGLFDSLPILLLGAGGAGFLVWNFPKARIFMGDVGSGFIGIILGVVSIQSAWISSELFWGWLILLGAFIVDATVTLLRRVARGEKFYEAHRSHSYQNASRKYQSHVYVSLAFAAINLFWLLPVAILVVIGRIDAGVGIILGYIPLIILAFNYKSGVREESKV